MKIRLPGFLRPSPHPNRKEIVRFVRDFFGFTPRRLSLYEQALRHKSRYERVEENNERLEFLGDSVLDAIVADYLFAHFPGETEGALTKMRAHIVSRKTLNKLAMEFGLERMVQAAVESDLRKTSIGGNALEAVIGAIYLEKGYAFTQTVVRENILEKRLRPADLKSNEFDPKSRLIEAMQKKQYKIEYVTREDEDNTDPQKHYVSEVFINGQKQGEGRGTSKKKAEQDASRLLWQQELAEQQKNAPQE